MSVPPLLLLGLGLFGVLCGTQLIGGFRDGRISPTGLELLRPPISREAHPVSFWLTVFFHAFGLCGAVGVIIASLLHR